LLLLTVVLAPAFAWAQMGGGMGMPMGGGMGGPGGGDPPDPVKMWLGRPGALIRKTMMPVGSVSDVTVVAQRMLDLRDAHEFKVVTLDRIGGMESAINMDAQLTDSLLKSLDLVSSTILNSTPENAAEVICRSMSGFEIRFLFNTKEAGGKQWKVALQMDKKAKDGYTYLSASEFEKFLALLKEARAKLN
jgi:hypothetical protein